MPKSCAPERYRKVAPAQPDPTVHLSAAPINGGATATGRVVLEVGGRHPLWAHPVGLKVGVDLLPREQKWLGLANCPKFSLCADELVKINP